MSDLHRRLQDSVGDAYIIERELGGGGMSRVFLAHDTALGRKIVIKMLLPELAAGVSMERFRREVQLLAQLQHPHIVPVHSAGELNGLPFFTMPFVEGESLRTRLARDGELPIPEAVRLLRNVASALTYAHAQGVIHRDIKPDNILISAGVAVVTDFGVSKAVTASTAVVHTGASATRITSMGVALGTPAYMAPEQATADPAMDHRVDIYAFGVMAYEMLVGRPPFTERSPQAMLAAHVVESPEPILRHRPTVPHALSVVVMRCLGKRPADRPQTAGEIMHVLDAIATPSEGTAPTGAVRSSVRERLGLISTTGGGRPSWYVFAAAGLLAAGAFLYGQRRARETDHTPHAAANAAANTVAASAVAANTVAATNLAARPPVSVAPAPAAPPMTTATAPGGSAAPAREHRAAEPPPSRPPRESRVTPPPATPPAARVTQERAGSLALSRSDSAPARFHDSALAAPRRAGAESAGARTPSMAGGDSALTAATPPAAAAAPVRPPAAPPSTPRPAPDPRNEVQALVASYEAAIESRDMASIRRVYHGLTPAQQKDWEQFFEVARNIDVSLSIAQLDVNGDSGEARLTGTYAYENSTTHRAVRDPVTLLMGLRREGGAWRIGAIR